MLPGDATLTWILIAACSFSWRSLSIIIKCTIHRISSSKTLLYLFKVVVDHRDDSCQLAWSHERNGPVVGCWDGTVKLFENCGKDPKAIWNDHQYPEDPIRGLVVCSKGDSKGNIVVCNDFQLTFLDASLSKVLGTIKAKESNTCKQC